MRGSPFFRSGWRAAIVAGMIALWPIDVARAMNPDRALSQYIRNRWEKGSGFVAGPVYAITQTRDGYLWIAAEKGIVRFDGLRFHLFQALQPTSTTDIAALNVLPDPAGGLWTWLRRAALMRLRNGAFENALNNPGLPELRVGLMAPGNDATILIADTRLGLQVWRAGHLETVLPREALPRPFVTAIAQTPDGDIWLGTHNAGLVRVQRGHAAPVAGVPVSQINCLAADERNGLWIGADTGIFRWDGSSVKRVALPPEAGRARALAMVRDHDRNVWVGTSDGLLRIDSHGAVSFEPRESSAAVTALFEDREGNLWVGDASGVERWRDGAFASYTTVDPAMAGSIGPVFSDATDRLWFAPASGGLYWIRDGRVGGVAALRGDVIYSIAGDGEAILVGRQRGGMTRVLAHDDAAVPFTIESFTERDGLAQNHVFAVHRARDGAVWAGTIGRGASRLADGAFTTYTTKDGLPSNTIAAVLDTADGAVWLATPNGASVKSADGWRRYSTADGLPSNDVNTLFEDSARTLWIGTAAGLAAMHDGRMQALPAVPALLRTSVLGLAEDRAGGLWIAATDRVLRVDRDKLLRGALGAGDLREFSAADGVLDTDVIKRHRVLTADSRGRIWLSTNGGLVSADSRRVAAGIAPALVHVEEVSADGSHVKQAPAMTIPPRPERITFGFAALSLSVPDRVRFRYRLDGFDRDWSAPVAERQAVFTNLGPGTYRFRVIASNSDGAWNGTEAALPFTIAPAWSQMGSFWAAIGLLVIGGAWGAYRMRLRQLARQLHVRFEDRLAERSRIARELHDTLLQSFQGAILRFRAVTYMLPDRPTDARATLEDAIDLARQAIVEGRDAVQGLRSTAVATNDIAVAIATLASTLSTDDGGRNPLFSVNVEGTPRDLPPMVQDEAYRVAGEALRNAFRHARASRIEVEIRYDQQIFRMRVRDDGKGIDAAAAGGRRYDGHYGMAGMHERATLIGGTLSVWSELDAGTEVELTIPASVAYARAAAV
ncbi:MAG TPA: two-component regulator propeller domain-containing protein [Vicinamibacterales bacterium]|nr:two-component regulator propeller domain-containing protein [Vicinamibacterales bacterium]